MRTWLWAVAPLIMLSAIACGGPATPSVVTPPLEPTSAPLAQQPSTAAGATADQPSSPDPGLAAPPELAQGEALYSAKCASCHGQGAMGTDKGPAFLHPVYVASHHPDEAFSIAALVGVQAHHWRFGDMPPVDGVTQADVLQIVAYVRWLQQQAQE